MGHTHISLWLNKIYLKIIVFVNIVKQKRAVNLFFYCLVKKMSIPITANRTFLKAVDNDVDRQITVFIYLLLYLEI